MIKNTANLRECLREDKTKYFNSFSEWLELFLTHDVRLELYRYVKLLRFTEYYHNKNTILSKLIYAILRRKKNALGIKLGVEIWDNTFDSGLQIFHAGNIVVNGMSKIGKNCMLHGSNCIGNNGYTKKCPQIGDNVRLGVGAKVIGDVVIANNVVVAAGAVVVTSFLDEGITVAGVPAKQVYSRHTSIK